VQVKYLFWVIGIAGFGGWGLTAILRPEVLFSTFRKHAARSGGVPWFLDRWLSSTLFQIEMRIWGAVSILIAVFLLWFLVRELLSYWGGG
jgi:hypothetical protein